MYFLKKKKKKLSTFLPVKIESLTIYKGQHILQK